MRILLTISATIFLLSASGQDYILSQYFNAPLMLNPALTGNMEMDLRASIGRRNQWASISNAFVTTTASYDMPLLRKNNSPNYLGVGGFVLKDKAGKSQLGLLQATGSVAYAVGMSKYNTLMSGLQVSYGQRSIQMSDLAWDSQFNGIGYDPSLGSGENFSSEKRSSVDLSAGVVWSHHKDVDYTLGYMFSHYGQRQGFLGGASDKLFTKHVFHADWMRKWRHVDLTLQAKAARQSGAMELNLGVQGKYRTGLDSKYTDSRTSSAVMAGAYYRIGDAISPMIGYEYQRMIIAWFSYDINISKLHLASAYNGGWEVHLAYNGWLTQQRRKLH
jgi:type IX secretion system PorP/SprF family membrane protein